MSTPDVRVRLSPQGAKEVIGALRQVQNEGRKANAASGRGIQGLKKELLDLKRLLPTLGLAAAVTGVILLGRSALRAADEMGDLAQVTGTTAANLSVFRREAELGGATLEDVRVGLVTLAQRLGNLRAGQGAATQGFAALGLAAEDFIGLDTVEAAQKVAEALAREEDATRRTALAKQVLGESGARLLPTMITLADKGFARAADEAARLGLVIDDELAAAAGAAQDGLDQMGQQVRGLATQFIAGLAPAIVQSMTTFEDETAGKGVDAMRTFGQGVGRILGAIINLFRVFADVASGTFEIFGKTIGAALAAANQAARLNFSEANEIMRQSGEDTARIVRETFTSLGQDVDRLITELSTDPPPIEPRVRIDTGGLVDPGLQTNPQLVKARLDAVKKRLDAELALQKASNEALLEENDRAFTRGLISLEQFHERRRQIAERTAQAEIAALRMQRAALEAADDTTAVGPAADAERLKLRTELGELDNRIRLRELELSRELSALEADRFDQARELGEEQLRLANTLDELEGNRHAVFQRNLEAEIRQIRELGARAGQTAEEIEATVERLSGARTARFDFDQATNAGREALEAFNRDAELIRRDAELGLTSQLEGERRLIELQRQRLEVLRQLAEASLAAARATGDPAAIAQAQQFADSIDQIALSFRAATDAGTQFRSGAIDAFEQGLADLLANADQIESLEDAFKSLARTVAQTMARIAAEILARQAVLALLKAFGSGGGSGGGEGGGALAQLFGFRGGLVRGYDIGGTIGGPTLPIPGPDRTPILAQKGEFMIRKAIVDRPGVLSFLRDLNAGKFSARHALALPRFAEGGVIGGISAPALGPETDRRGSRGVRVVNAVDPMFAIDAMQGPAGEEVVVNVIRRNSATIRQLLSS